MSETQHAQFSPLRAMPPRDPGEAHRAATPLELLFDLVSVIAIAAAAAGLHHAIAENHLADGIVTFVMAFFAIWWAWMNFTWFASAYDNDDTLFRLLTMVTMGGALTMAAGVSFLFSEHVLTTVIVGYVIMRVAMVLLWLRAARHDSLRRRTALAYALGILIAQIYWVLLILIQPLSGAWLYGLFVLGVILELAVPAIAERYNTTPWHRHHIIERYGLLNIIVLGETLLAGSIAIRQAAAEGTLEGLVPLAIAALIMVFCLWWLYFGREDHLQSSNLGRALTWGYGHFLIFASGAAMGGGFAALVDIMTKHAEVPLIVGDYAVAIPVALYMFGLWFVRDRFVLSGAGQHVLLVFAALVLLVPLSPLALEAIAAVTVASVIARTVVGRSQYRAGSHG
ncbi:low temperature requirement A [Nitratireductor indicus C115]|uniref:Low temperature requirement A n=1 Tax=Nitratireductor indicus C115 TaxID=1231190 RepID=K2N0D1_9HYPH|nr:low temperature requirement protein A [Nitratireductor indicus]EKF40978.1 low temperature requirement A [Nitratireductor indicus C115]SFQ73581.1 Low temperature requirement protein LtrA [Nitratireductor indicus]